MKITSRSSRRTFVMGGAAAAACMGPLAVAELARTQPARKSAASPSSARSEVGEWERLVGVSFLVAGEAGKAPAKLAAVVRPAVDPKRPGDLARFQPFTAYFEMDARLAPKGQFTYRVVHPAKGLIDLFLTRGADKRGKAVLLALFN